MIIDMIKQMRILRDKSGHEMVEASMTLPIIILTTVLLVRIFTFYLEILDTQVKTHEDALNKNNSYERLTFTSYKKNDSVKMMKFGILKFDLEKKINTKLYLYNEDKIIRAGELLEK